MKDIPVLIFIRNKLITFFKINLLYLWCSTGIVIICCHPRNSVKIVLPWCICKAEINNIGVLKTVKYSFYAINLQCFIIECRYGTVRSYLASIRCCDCKFI